MKKRSKKQIANYFYQDEKDTSKGKKLIFIMMMKVLKIDLALCLKENII